MTLIAKALSISQPTVSRHLAILSDAGFIRVSKHQKLAYCKRDEAEILDYLKWLGSQLSERE